MGLMCQNTRRPMKTKCIKNICNCIFNLFMSPILCFKCFRDQHGEGHRSIIKHGGHRAQAFRSSDLSRAVNWRCHGNPGLCEVALEDRTRGGVFVETEEIMSHHSAG